MRPQNFFIGVIDFFSIIVPGGLITWFLSGHYFHAVFGADKIFPVPDNVVVMWVVFLVITYILGHVIFSIASILDVTYDKYLRKLFLRKLDLRHRAAALIQQKYINTDLEIAALHERKAISSHELVDMLRMPKREIFNALSFAQHFLQFRAPEALKELKKTEADSKFFRSLVIAFLIIAIVSFQDDKRIEGYVFVVLLFLCYYRFGQLRFKTSQTAYELLITYDRIQQQGSSINSAVAISSSALATDIQPEFLSRYGETITFLTKGLQKNIRQLMLPPDASPINFRADADQQWYCMQGTGAVFAVDDGRAKTLLVSNAIVPFTKGFVYSVSNEQSESLQVLMVEN